MPSNLTLRTMNAFHRSLLAVSRGHLGWRAAGMPVLRLTTTGRRSGRPHTVMLTSPLQEGSTIVVVASRGGDDRHPAWFVNLRENPEVGDVLDGAPGRRMRARIAASDERPGLWSRLTADHQNYARYQSRTQREIPVVLLEPID